MGKKEKERKGVNSTKNKQLVVLPLLSSSAFIDFSGSKQKPVCRHFEILNQRNEPSDLEIAFAVIRFLSVPVSAVKSVCVAKAGKPSGQSLRIYQLLHHVKISFLNIQRVLFVCSCSTHFRNLGVPRPILDVLSRLWEIID